MSDAHTWALVIIVGMDAETAQRVHALDVPERLKRLPELVPVEAIRQIRGPMCSQCSVHLRDVEAASTPWPCPGKRPKAIGGPIEGPEEHKPRHLRRREMREAESTIAARNAKPVQIPGKPNLPTVKDSAEMAILTAQAKVAAKRESHDLDALGEPVDIGLANPRACWPETHRLEELVTASALAADTRRRKRQRRRGR